MPDNETYSEDVVGNAIELLWQVANDRRFTFSDEERQKKMRSTANSLLWLLGQEDFRSTLTQEPAK